tara:strand:+ start:1800 stop:2363 length:564 start_codon:yes stop_codon:yes gene_type:complete
MAYPRVFRRRFFCAYHDRPFNTIFAFSKQTRHWEIDRYEVSGSALTVNTYQETAGLEISEGRDVPVNRIKTESLVCPHCNTGLIKGVPVVAAGGREGRAFVHCGRCDELVCFGNSDDNLFRCRPSCGATGVPVPNFDTISGEQVQRQPEVSIAMGSQSEETPPPPQEALEAPPKRGLLAGVTRRLKR